MSDLSFCGRVSDTSFQPIFVSASLLPVLASMKSNDAFVIDHALYEGHSEYGQVPAKYKNRFAYMHTVVSKNLGEACLFNATANKKTSAVAKC